MANGTVDHLENIRTSFRPPWSDQPSGYQVVVNRYLLDEDGSRPIVKTLVLTPEQAEAQGISLPDHLAELNVKVITERDAALAAAKAATTERDALAERLAALEAAPPVQAAPAISDRQFFQALALAGDITQDEALAAVMTGTLPPLIEKAVQALPDAERFSTRMLLSGATTFERHHPMVAVLGTILDKDDAALDALWAAARTL